MILVVF